MSAPRHFAPPTIAPWYIVGLPGSGKSRVGQQLARFFGVAHIDTDFQVEKVAKRRISTIFDEDGEAAFRALETEAVLETAGKAAIVSLGGGAVETSAVRDFLEGQSVIWIDADTEELLARVSRNSRRPLLRNNPGKTLRVLRQRRDPLFRSLAQVRVVSTNAPVQRAVREVLRSALDWDFSSVTGQDTYRVVTGFGTTSLVGARIPSGATKVFVLTSESMADKCGPIVAELGARGLEVTLFTHVDGEGAKDLETVSRGWDALGRARIGRRDLVVTFGGGVTTDLGGFLAATWLRGVPVVHVPTTLLAMVDAAIGGKTGINTAAGKNLVGCFHDPIAVIIDLDTLETLPQDEYAAGMAEAIKTGLIRDEQILTDVEQNPQIRDVHWATTTATGREVLGDIVRRSVAVKAEVVSEDRLEGGLREILNYGHTMGHAIERAENYTMRHGQAVAIGSVFAANLAGHLGMASAAFVDRHTELFEAMGLSTHYRGDLEELMEGLSSDKKVRGGKLRFVLLKDQGQTQVLTVDPQDVRDVALQLGMGAAGV